jgi:arsenite methyltransferase
LGGLRFLSPNFINLGPATIFILLGPLFTAIFRNMSNYRNKKYLASIFQALANPHRLALLEHLSTCCRPGTRWQSEGQEFANVGELAKGLDLAPSTVSHHLKEMVRAGLISTERQGKYVICWLEPEVLTELAGFFKERARGPVPEEKDEIMENDQIIRQAVRERYARVAEQTGSIETKDSACGCCNGGGACTPPDQVGQALGYSAEELSSVPEGANLGLGCGNPQAIAELKPGETVLDLGSGGGFDCFLAAQQVGPSGVVIGVDMTPEMVARGRVNAGKMETDNVEFRLGEIEHLPVSDNSVDVIISNCVINLAPDKEPVYAEAMRVLKPGGRLAISDVVAIRPLPAEIKQDMHLWSGCAAGAMLKEELENLLARLGFQDIKVEIDESSKSLIHCWAPDKNPEEYLASGRIQAVKPMS